MSEGLGSGRPFARAPSRAARRVLLGALRAYQAARAGRVSPCRYWPSCSEYAAQAVERHGVWRGSLLALRRLGRCRPGGAYGFDPVPE
ncbi:MAG TPA: membrane protein insertion efficiency factor YidD [Acidimicrobiales bacterium]|jgi:putative membrane protein insertion efficiency factor|nr:membrane protein insertion efficiency factor YidD [Acidimicrobiales bacterium]